jgi:hypothetical protein
MANPEHLEILRQGVEVWNDWRAKEPSIIPNFREADLSWADLSGANLMTADLMTADLNFADLSGANLREADLSGADLSWADLSGANLMTADLMTADLNFADLSGADLQGANLLGVGMVKTNLTDAVLTDCLIHGISAWGVKISAGTIQRGLIITPPHEPAVTVDDLEVAQFVYLLLHNEKIRRVIDTITSKVVLILGRFSLPERKQVLDALRDELRKSERGYVPVVFDFERPMTQPRNGSWPI